jgi:hypothetical protein
MIEILIENTLMIINIAVLIQFILKDNYALSYIVLALSIRLSLFDYLLNWKRGKNIFYLGKNFTDRMKKKLPVEFRVFVELWILIVGILQYLYILIVGILQYLYLSGRIYQQYSMLGIEPF